MSRDMRTMLCEREAAARGDEQGYAAEGVT